jgi:Polyketide cyclase / dehydrase and lipid transport
MTSSPEPAFSYSHVIETEVPAGRIWALYDDVSTWPQWDQQAEVITRDGPFAAGSTGTMKFTGQDPMPYRLVSVQPEREFTDETPVGDLVVRVSHRLEPVAGGRLRVTYAAQIFGPAGPAREVGPMITADFPDTMASLIALAAEPAGVPNVPTA